MAQQSLEGITQFDQMVLKGEGIDYSELSLMSPAIWDILTKPKVVTLANGYAEASLEEFLSQAGFESAPETQLPEYPDFTDVAQIPGVDQLLNSEVATADSWIETSHLPAEVTVLGFDRPDLQTDLQKLSILGEIYNAPQATPEQINDAANKYGQLFERLANYLGHHYRVTTPATDNVYTLTMLQGADRMRPYFNKDQQAKRQNIGIEVKRINVEEKNETKPQMLFALDTEHEQANPALKQAQKQTGIHLVIPDDCIATAGSALASMAALQKQGVVIDKVSFYATIGAQQGIEFFINQAKAMGITEVEVVVIGLAPRLNKKGYIEYADGSPAVWDMGLILSHATNEQ